MTTASTLRNYDGGETHSSLVILRFNEPTSLHDSFSFSLSACICNAMQEPALINNGSIMVWGGGYMDYKQNKLTTEERARQADIITLHSMLVAAVRLGALPGTPCSSGLELSIPSDDKHENIFEFLDGVPSEADAFSKRNPPPPYLFIRYALWYLAQDGTVKKQDRVVPAMFKGGHYYICSGEKTSKVFRVHDPASIFFTIEGHNLLSLHLSCEYGSGSSVMRCPRVFFERNCDGEPHNLICVPKYFNRGPSVWDKLR